MRRILALICALFAVSLAAVVGVRMSADAMAVIIGIILGLIASIPTSLILLWVLRQRDRQLDAQLGQAPRPVGQYPPVVVVNGHGPNGYGAAPYNPALTAGTSSSGPRSFKVIGHENTETIGDALPPFWDEL